MSLLKVKPAEIKTHGAQKHLLTRIQLEEAMVGHSIRLDPLPSYYAFARELETCEPSGELMEILQKLKQASQYSTRSMVKTCLSKHMFLMTTADAVGNMIQEYGWGEAKNAKPALMLEWLQKKETLAPHDVQCYSQLPYSKCSDVLEMMPRIQGDTYTRFEQILSPLKNKLTPAEKDLAAKVICDRIRLIAEEVNGLRRIEYLPRKFVGDTVVVTLPTPATHTFEQLIKGWRD